MALKVTIFVVELIVLCFLQQCLASVEQQIQQERRHYYNKQLQYQHQYNKVYGGNYQPYYYKNQQQYQQNYYKNYNYYYKYKGKYKYMKWPRIRGRCSHSPWKINGKNPVLEEAEKNKIVVLYMLKARDRFSYNQLDRLNNFAADLKKKGQAITIIALNRRTSKLPDDYGPRFKNIIFYQEPRNQDIYKKLYAKYRQVIIYDICGRQQYHFGYPYSWLGYPLVRMAVNNVRRFHDQNFMCGKCKPYVPPTTLPPNPGNNTVAITTSIRTSLVKPTESAVDGPYTNISQLKK